MDREAERYRGLAQKYGLQAEAETDARVRGELEQLAGIYAARRSIMVEGTDADAGAHQPSQQR